MLSYLEKHATSNETCPETSDVLYAKDATPNHNRSTRTPRERDQNSARRSYTPSSLDHPVVNSLLGSTRPHRSHQRTDRSTRKTAQSINPSSSDFSFPYPFRMSRVLFFFPGVKRSGRLVEMVGFIVRGMSLRVSRVSRVLRVLRR